MRAGRRRANEMRSLLIFLLSVSSVDAFYYYHHHAFSTTTPSSCRRCSDRYRLSATRDKTEKTTSWSRRPGESRFGIRRRVRDVLKKAKDRTGVPNLNTESTRNVVAEAASIGAFENESDLIFRYARPKEGTEEDLVLPSYVEDDGDEGDEVDVLLNSEIPVEPLPFSLPKLNDEQRKALKRGERVQEQSKMGREGSGYVVMDIKAPPFVIWECLLDFEAYPKNIGTVRSMQMFTNEHLESSYISEKPVLPGTGRETRHYGTATITRASFVLSKFQLKIAAVHQYFPHPDGHFMVFTLDKACKNMVLQDAKGIWYTQKNPDGRGEEYTRVWLLCELKVSSLLPTFIVDYAAKRAMPRATTWLPPLAEEAAVKWLQPSNGANGDGRLSSLS